MRALTTALAASLLAIPASAQSSDVSMFPKAQPGDERVVLRLAPRRDETSARVEIYAGRVQPVDCNRHFLGENITERNLEGWGYPFWTVKDVPGGSTMMACPHTPIRTAFVSGPSQLIRYNSRLPIVVYVPKGYQLRYRIWSATTPEAIARKG